MPLVKTAQSEQPEKCKCDQDWMQTHWRPSMGYTYMVICIFDFILAPILWTLVQAFQQGAVAQQWDPLTLMASGFFHVAMGAVLGVAAWTRGSEKVAIVKNNGTQKSPE